MKEEFYKIEKPDLSKIKRSEGDWEKYNFSEDFQEILERANKDYLPWIEFKNKSWVKLDRYKSWESIKFIRQMVNTKTFILDDKSKFFSANLSIAPEFLHQIDMELGGNLAGIIEIKEGERQKLIKRNLIEESIASSQLEGANTSRKVAKEMLLSGRKPKDKSEQMIVNNHEVMAWMESELKNEELSFELICEIHKRITKNTLEEKYQGVIRNTFDDKGERLKIYPFDDNTVAYVTPTKEFVESQLPILIKFANDKLETGFIHPIIKAIMLHFWIGLLHPFEDGNGRLARILFYWYALRKGYWAFSYLSISEMIKNSPKQYAMAYIYSEQDDNDLNYFLHYNIEKIKLAKQKFFTFLNKKIEDKNRVISLISKGSKLNQRQLELLQYFSEDKKGHTTLTEYLNYNSEIKKLTAINDLKELHEKGFLRKVKNGRNVFYFAEKEKIRAFLVKSAGK